MTTKERPIIFSGDMVRAILDGRKTQTRRVVKIAQHPQAERVQHFEGLRWDWLRYDGLRLATFKCPYGKESDRLWVRETHKCRPTWAKCSEGGFPFDCFEGVVQYREDGSTQTRIVHLDQYTASLDNTGSRWRPSIHMPRWASRITLEITDIRVERLQDISEEDVCAEGLRGDMPDGSYSAVSTFDPISHYEDVWESINGPGSWDANPWVWCISFRRVTP